MKVLLVSHTERVSQSTRDLLGNGKLGCSELHCCSLDQSPERASQLRPDVVVMEVSAERPDSAWNAIHEIQETELVRVLVVGPSTDARLILETLNEGAFKYIDAARIADDLPSALRRTRDEPAVKAPRGKVISVMGASGGCGASTIAANVAASLCRDERGAILIDMDLDCGDLASLLRVQPDHSIADFCQNIERMDAQMFQKCLATQPNGLSLLAPPARYQDVGKVTPRGVRKAVSMARARFPYVVIDVARTYRSEQAQALFLSDVIVVALRLDFPSVRQAGRVLDYLADLRIDRDRIRLVANRTSAVRELRERDVETALKLPVALTVPEGSRHMSRAVTRGVPLVVDRPRSTVAQVLANLAGSLNGKM